MGTAPVGSFKLNALGFYDLGGNVTEWMLDGFDRKDPKANRVLRGGCWYNGAYSARCANRNSNPINFAFNRNSFGVRLARERLQSGEPDSR